MNSDIQQHLRVRREIAQLELRFGSKDDDHAPRPDDVDRRILHWHAFAPDFGGDDAILVQDYLAFMWERDRLQAYLDAAEPETRAYVTSLIEPVDEAFRQATIDSDPGLATRYRQANPGWWWMRTPKHPGASLRPELGP